MLVLHFGIKAMQSVNDTAIFWADGFSDSLSIEAQALVCLARHFSSKIVFKGRPDGQVQCFILHTAKEHSGRKMAAPREQ